MNQTTIDPHDFLGKLSIIKNHLFMALEDKNLPPKSKNLLQKAYQANEELIGLTKQKSSQNPRCPNCLPVRQA